MGLGLSIHHFNLTMNLDPNALCLPKFSYLILTKHLGDTQWHLVTQHHAAKYNLIFLTQSADMANPILFHAAILSFLKLYITYSRSKPS